MKHLYLKDNGEVKDASTSLMVGTWHRSSITGDINIFLSSAPVEVKHEVRVPYHNDIVPQVSTIHHAGKHSMVV